nr:11609_t:CDS:2 [Entrophospora candida]
MENDEIIILDDINNVKNNENSIETSNTKLGNRSSLLQQRSSLSTSPPSIKSPSANLTINIHGGDNNTLTNLSSNINNNESTVMLLAHDSSDDELENSSSTQKSILLSPLKDNDHNSNNKKPDAYNYTLSWGNILKNLSYILIWYFFSTVLSFYNKSLMGKDNFNLKLPLFTSAIHTGMHSIITLVLMNDTLPFIYERKKGKSISIHSYVTRVIPCAVAAALEICMANASLVYITLSFYTMVKSSTPVWVLLFAFLFHLEQPRILLVLIITVISVGVILTVAGETKFNLMGFLLVLGAAIISGLRWTLTQILLQKEEGMNDPISTLYYISPVMFIMMLILSLMFENPLFIFSTSIHFRSFKTSLQTFGLMLTGGLLAFCMTVAEFALIKNTSTVTLSVAGISKEVLVIALSVIIYNDAITSVNLLGLIISISGITVYNYYKILKPTNTNHYQSLPSTSQ